MSDPNRDRFLALLRSAVDNGELVKLTLGKCRGEDRTVRNLFVRPVVLKAGPHLSFLWRHATRDVTRNLPPPDALAEIDRLLSRDFLDAHLFTTTQHAQFETQSSGTGRLKLTPAPRASETKATAGHDRAKQHLIPADSPWLRALGVTNDRGQPREGMADKFRQIQKFAEVLGHLLDDAAIRPANATDAAPPTRLRIVDMGSGKGYLTFAVAALLDNRATVTGVEARPELVELCNRIARENDLAHLSFAAGRIDSFAFPAPDAAGAAVDVLIALHACDTATDDALAKGIAAGARLLVVSPCCQKELRPQLVAPPVLADALRHGIFQERQAEFVTDSLRAQLLEWAGYRTKVFEFISTEHTAKNLMITAIKDHATGDASRAARIREFAQFYGIRRQRLAQHLEFSL